MSSDPHCLYNLEYLKGTHLSRFLFLYIPTLLSTLYLVLHVRFHVDSTREFKRMEKAEKKRSDATQPIWIHRKAIDVYIPYEVFIWT